MQSHCAAHRRNTGWITSMLVLQPDSSKNQIKVFASLAGLFVTVEGHGAREFDTKFIQIL